VRSLYGDGTHRHVLERAGVGQAALVVVAIPDVERTDLVVRHARALNPEVPILARAHHDQSRERLVRAGATEVIVPELEAAATLIRHALKGFAFPRDRVLAYLERLRAAMETGAGEISAVASGLPQITDIVIGRGALAGQSLREARVLERLGVTVVAVDHAEGPVSMASGETVLRAGDRVRVFGLPSQIDAFRAEAERPD
jgi:CPA2 family monovalent cation:H+ antiporter-2